MSVISTETDMMTFSVCQIQLIVKTLTITNLFAKLYTINLFSENKLKVYYKETYANRFAKTVNDNSMIHNLGELNLEYFGFSTYSSIFAYD